MPESVPFVWTWKPIFTLCLLIVTFVSLIKEKFPADFTLFGAALLLVLCGIVEPKDFLKGFSKDVLFCLAFLFILARAIELNGFLEMSKAYILPKSKRPFSCLLRLMAPLAIASAFVSNTPIVLIFTSLVRKWALENKTFPSKYLIPLSYATILGGVCTLIGTSVNLVVDGLLRSLDIGESIAFFDLAAIGIPCAIVGILFMATIGYHLLPKRKDPSSTVQEYTRETSHEFIIDAGCPLIEKQIKEVSKTLFKGALIIEIYREHHCIEAPRSSEWLEEGDRLVFLGTLESFHALQTIPNLRPKQDPSFSLDAESGHFSEVVISFTSSLIGRTLEKVNFRNTYQASVIALFREGKPVQEQLSTVPLHAGDTLMLLTAADHFPAEKYTNDFYLTKMENKKTSINLFKVLWPVGILLMMIIVVLSGVPLLYASLGAAILAFVSKSISFKEMGNAVQWHILLLISSAYVLGQAVVVTGLADWIAMNFLPLLGSSPFLIIGGILALTLLFTEVITNTAAALLIFPIGVEMMLLSGYNTPMAYKAVAVTVALGASCSFATPIGYQTNTIIYGPGAYKFLDYARVGLPLTCIIWLMGSFLIPLIWPFTS